MDSFSRIFLLLALALSASGTQAAVSPAGKLFAQPVQGTHSANLTFALPKADPSSVDHLLAAFRAPSQDEALQAVLGPEQAAEKINSSVLGLPGEEATVERRSTSVPEPSIVLLFATGLLALLLSRRRGRG